MFIDVVIDYFTLKQFNPLSAKKFFVSNYSQNLYKHPQDVPIDGTTMVFWNKALLKSYKTLYFFGFLNSVTLSFKIFFRIF